MQQKIVNVVSKCMGVYKMVLLLDSVSHFLVDGVCAATIFGSFTGSNIALLVMLYNTLAFSTQCIVGLITDKIGHIRCVTALGSALVVLGFLLPAADEFRVVLIGLGNSIFHVGGGTRTLLNSKGKAGPLGVFVAPGSIGLTLGTLFPQLGPWFAFLLAACAAAVFLTKSPSDNIQTANNSEKGSPVVILAMLTLAVAVRAVGGTCVSFPWKTGAFLSVVMTCFVFAGKAFGGFVCDRFGSKFTALITMTTAGILIAFFSSSMTLSLIGQLLVNLTMPVTLFLMYKAIPDSPGFAFGLAASALWPGTIAGNMIQLTGLWQSSLILVCFAFGLFAIIYSNRRLME